MRLLSQGEQAGLDHLHLHQLGEGEPEIHVSQLPCLLRAESPQSEPGSLLPLAQAPASPPEFGQQGRLPCPLLPSPLAQGLGLGGVACHVAEDWVVLQATPPLLLEQELEGEEVGEVVLLPLPAQVRGFGGPGYSH